jgi:hypothetical protein
MEKTTPYRVVAVYGWSHLTVDLVTQACLFRVIASLSSDPKATP